MCIDTCVKQAWSPGRRSTLDVRRQGPYGRMRSLKARVLTEKSQRWSTSTVKGSQKEKEPTKEVKGWPKRQFLARQQGENFQLAGDRPFARQSLWFEMCDFGWRDVILVYVAHAGFMEALGLGKAAWIMSVCVCLLRCLHYMAGRTHMPQEMEACGQGSPPYKAAWGISFHLTEGKRFNFSFCQLRAFIKVIS